MIISIDHIALTSKDIEKDIETYKKLGYEQIFYENLKNLEIKKEFLTNYVPNHEISLLQNQEGYNIELLNHGEISENDGYVNLVEKNKIVVSTQDINSSIDFWSLLGFKQVTDNTMEFFSFFNKKQLILEFKESELSKRHLNDKGYNCIGFITNSAQSEWNNLKSKDCYVTEIQQLTVNSKSMKIFFAQHNNNEIIEIIEIAK